MFITLFISYTITYKIENDRLLISTLGWKRVISLDSIAEVNVCSSDRVLRLRKFGIGIPNCLKLGYYTGDYGDVTSYVTSSKNILLIELKNGKKLAINPKSPNIVIEALKG